MAAPESSSPVGGWRSETTAMAQAWVAQFAPLVLDDESVSADEARRRIALIDRLRTESARLRERLDSDEVEAELRSTFEKAASELDSLDSDYRKRLAKLSPGDPLSKPNLDAIRDRIAERDARQELGVPTLQEVPAVLELETSPSNWAGAVAPGLFGLGWTAFTVFHSVLMIGGLMRTVGPVSLFLLLFYAIFYAIGFGMLWSAFRMLMPETIKLEGTKLAVTRRLGGLRLSKEHDIDPHVTAAVNSTLAKWARQGNAQSLTDNAIVMTDVHGKPVTIAAGTTDANRRAICEKINAYFAATVDR